MHTAPFACAAHFSLSKRAYGENMQAAGLVGSKLTDGHGESVVHTWIGVSEDCDGLLMAGTMCK